MTVPMIGADKATPARFVRACPHAVCAVAALLFMGALSAGLQGYVQARLPGRMASFASRPSAIKLTGNILQSEAFRLPAVLPIYGSSELDRPADNRPDEFFRDRPTGFTTFPIGRGGTTCLMMLQKVAAVGSGARGKKVVIILSGSWFAKESVGEEAVGANLTSPQLSAWLFGDGLSVALRQRIVRRLLDYPGTLDGQLLLDGGVRCLASPTRLNRWIFVSLEPLGWLQNALFRKLEYAVILREMILYPGRPAPVQGRPRVAAGSRDGPGELDWTRLADKAEAMDRALDDGAVYSATNARLPENRRAEHLHKQAPGTRDEDFDARLLASKEFDDLQLLIDVLKELGVDALFISQPFNGIYRDLGGTSRRGRQVYYDKLASILGPSGYRLLEFADHDEDRFFFNDANHPSAKAWIFYDRAIDRFFHQTHG